VELSCGLLQGRRSGERKLRVLHCSSCSVLNIRCIGALSCWQTKLSSTMHLRASHICRAVATFEATEAAASVVLQDCCLSENNITSTIFSEREWVHGHYMLSPVRLSVVCNVSVPYSGGSNFPHYFYGIKYLGHPLTSTENFTEIVAGEPLRRGVKHKTGTGTQV